MTNEERHLREAEKFIDTIEKFILAIIQNHESSDVEDAINLINAKQDLLEILIGVE